MIGETYLIILVIFFSFTLLFLIINSKLNKITKKSQLDENLLKIINNLQTLSPQLQDNLQQQSKNISDSLQKSNKTINERLDNASRFIAQVAKEVGEMREIGRSMKELQEFLKSPKLRGNIGEEVLKDLISQMFPKNSFHLQYSFKNGSKVDAVLKTDAGILPIDSKFPMENFQKMVREKKKELRKKIKKTFISDVKKHIKDISQKYILPEEGTMDFALMYIPSEPVYYEIVNVRELNNYARQKRVYPVSPTTLYAHLQMILLSFEGKKIELKSKQVFRLLRAIQKDYQKTEGVLQILGKHLNNAYNQFSKVWQNFSLLGQKLSSTQILSESIKEANKPKEDNN